MSRAPRASDSRRTPEGRLPNALAARLQSGIQLHRSGRLAEAEAIYRDVLAVAPKLAAAADLLGLVLQHAGRPGDAIEFAERAVSLAPGVAEYQNNRGLVLQALGRAADAEAAFRRALKINRNYPEALANLAGALHRQRKLDEAAECLRRAVQLRPEFVEARSNLGAVLLEAGRSRDALAVLQQAVAERPSSFQGQYNLGNALKALGEKEKAIEAYRRALALRPNFAAAHNNLGHLLLDLERTEDAVVAFRQAVAAAPNDAIAHHNLGTALYRAKRRCDAIESYKAALRLDPGHLTAAFNLAEVLAEIGEPEAAVELLRRLLPHYGNKAVALSDLLTNLNYLEDQTPESILAEHLAYQALYPAVTRVDAVTVPRRGGRLRVGYVSPDFRTHSCAFFFEPLLAAHDRAAIEVFCYASVKHPDETTERLQALAEHWRDIVAMEDGAAAALIEEDGIDVLVDLAGHTAGNRLGIFALKPAPVQVSWLGYPGTTGLSTMDYRLTDEWADPPGRADQVHTEKLVRLGGGFLCYQAPGSAPDCGTAPAASHDDIVFGSFNNISKVGPSVVACWSEILRAVPDSRLLLKSRPFYEAPTRERYAARFEAHGIERGRLMLMPWVEAIEDSLKAYCSIDVALDTFPYNGTTTTCEALWMGVPVVTLAGDRHAARVGLSLLHAVGQAELVAATPAAYVDLAVSLASDRARLARYRHTLRQQLRGSPLCDAARFARAVEAAFRGMCQDGAYQGAVS